MSDTVTIPAAAAIAGLRSHPQFQAAMRQNARGLLAPYRGNRLLNSLMSDRARALFANAVLYLHYAGTSDGRPGLTAGSMKDLCVRLGLCSRGRCETMLALMRAAGLLVAAPYRPGLRRPLAPTEKLLALQRERWAANLGAMELFLPEAKSYRAALDDPGFFSAFELSIGEAYIAGLRLLDNAAGLEIFTERNGGIMILFSLALAGPADGPFPPVGPLPLSISALAKTFSVSRKHVLMMLRDAEAQGLLARGGRANDEITVLPRLRDAIEIFFATLFLFTAACAERSLPANGKTAARAG